MANLTIKLGSETLANVERKLILGTLRACKGDKMRAALALGIGLTTIYAKLRMYGEALAKSETEAVK